MEDYLVKALCYKGSIRAYAISALKLLAKRKEDMIHGVLLPQR
ncbi:Chaperonin (heat shock protein 33) [Enterococcus faecalis ATCC 29212]|nr:Chaperonin (heat shock protein 33) [Enterococcus faecalis ATCC 29212]